MAKYIKLRRANMATNFLDTNSTTHEFLFGALAELVDNARDAEAKNLHIYSIRREELRGNYILCFRDDGSGMTPDESLDVIVFGKSSKKSSDINLIGQYGNGLKSGAYRIGKEILIFTKKNGVGTIIFISGDFLAQEKLKEIVVPMPSFDMKTMTCYQPGEEDATSRHNLELEVITKYSPFKSKQELIGHFDKIGGASGTLVMVYKLVLVGGESELDFETDPHDIQMRDVTVTYDRKERSYPAHKSFREYVSILYDDPRMSIFIQKKRVATKILEKCLYKPVVFTFAGKMFKTNATNSKEEAEEELRVAKTNLTEARSTYHFADKTYHSRRDRENKEGIKELTEAKRRQEEAEKEVLEKTRQVEKRKRDINAFQSLRFTFGINIHNRDSDGLFIYNGHRLLIMHESTKHQLGSDREEYRGIVGVVNVPYFCAKPTQNKQAFANQAEQKNLLNVMADCMVQYVNQLSSFTLSDRAFWSKYGYPGRDMRGGPAVGEESDRNALKTRIQDSRLVLQCTECLKWRVVRPTPRSWTPGYYTDNWRCSDNTDIDNANCSRPEDLTPSQTIPVLEYQKPKETNFREIEREVNFIPRDNSSFQRLEPRAAKQTAVTRMVEDGMSDDDVSIVEATTRAGAGSKRKVTESNAGQKKSRTASTSSAATASAHSDNYNPRRARQVNDDEEDEDDGYYQDVLEMTTDIDLGHAAAKKEPSINGGSVGGNSVNSKDLQIRELTRKNEELAQRLKGILLKMCGLDEDEGKASMDQLAKMSEEDLLRVDINRRFDGYNKNVTHMAISTLEKVCTHQKKQPIDSDTRRQWKDKMNEKFAKIPR